MTRTIETTIGGSRGLRPKLFSATRKLLGLNAAHFIFRMADMAALIRKAGQPGLFGSVDITCRCNLNCKHCYFTAQGYRRELTDDEWVAHFDRLKEAGFPFYQCSWIGGEPLLRRELIERLMPRFKSNLIATNGSLPLPDWRDANFYVSVDGTIDYYERMRGNRSLYERIKKNINDAPQLKIVAAMCVSKENHDCIPALLEEWRPTHVKGFLFQFYTPIKGDDALWPGWQLRDRIIDRLIRLKDRYEGFIINPVDELRLMKSAVAPSVTRSCRYAARAYAFGPDGAVKRPCMMGPGADCSRCGCVLPFHVWSVERRNLIFREVLLTLRKAVHNQSRRRDRVAAYQAHGH